jgi:uncharacterized membrane protein YbaN (DUF454 family)
MTQEPASSSGDTVDTALPKELCGPARVALQGLGGICVGLGILGLVLPGLPGTVFLLIALWAFSRSSHRLHLWLYNHPRFGASLRAWHRHRVIPTRAKIAAVATMSVSAVMIVVLFTGDWRIAALSIALMAVVALWIVTRPSRIAESA